MYKVVTLVGTRPELIRLSRIIPKFDDLFNHKLVFSGQNYDISLSARFFEQLGIRVPDYSLSIPAAEFSVFVGSLFIKLGSLLAELKPDVLVVLGDTNTGLGAIVARKLGIPVVHVEAGNRSYDLRVPEELNRRIIDTTSSFNVTYSNNSKDYLLSEGFRGDSVAVLGSPLWEVATYYSEHISKSTILSQLGLDTKGFLLLSLHRSELVNCSSFSRWFSSLLTRLIDETSLTLVCGLHPHTRSKVGILPDRSEKLIIREPFGYFDYIALQQNALVTLSDSGTITEEAIIYGLNALSIRDSHERPEGDDFGAVLHTSTSIDEIIRCVFLSIKLASNVGSQSCLVQERYREALKHIYRSEDFSDRLAKYVIRAIVKSKQESIYHLKI
jgi:UDP-N-acetyl-L-fucosamine synthase